MNYHDYKMIIYVSLGAGMALSLMIGGLGLLAQTQDVYSLFTAFVVLLNVTIGISLIAVLKARKIKKEMEEEWENGQS